jgi:GNAT-family acetyltransferase (TIGR03103 family)
MKLAKEAVVESQDILNSRSLKHWGELPPAPADAGLSEGATVHCGWGRLLFGQTFETAAALAEAFSLEHPDERDIALYVRDPHVVIAHAPHALFLDPSFTFRLDLRAERHRDSRQEGIIVRMASEADEAAINRIYLARRMVPMKTEFLAEAAEREDVYVLVAEDRASGDMLGVTMGVDHVEAFNDLEQGSSLWALAVDPQASLPRVGVTLTSALSDHFRKRGREFMDLSVMHDNQEAIALYRKLGFVQVPVYCVKARNTINEPLFVARNTEDKLNVYAQILVDEARRRGIRVDIIDAGAGLFELSLGGRRIACRESLTDLTSAVALSRCDDKVLTRNLVTRAGIKMPAQTIVEDEDVLYEFLERHGRIVVKPARGEQGRAVSVDIRTRKAARSAYRAARAVDDRVVAEALVDGDDLRVIVIDKQAVAAAVRRPPSITGDGESCIRDLIKRQSRRRETATSGESTIPCDAETERCVASEGYDMDTVLPSGKSIVVRKTANLHTGGTIHDVTDDIHPVVREAAIAVADALAIPVTGIDFIVPDVTGSEYWMIEANERPGLANHEPQPTAERFIDFLFPDTAV